MDGPSNQKPESEPLGTASVDDLNRGARIDPLSPKIRLLGAVVQHAVTLILLVTVGIVAPILYLLAHWLISDKPLQEVSDFLRVWFSTVSALAATAVGWYFRGMTEKLDGRK
jgi:hypothetical protein